jgi:hypothetical protein
MEHIHRQISPPSQFLLDSAHIKDRQIEQVVEKLRDKPKEQRWCCVACGNYVCDDGHLIPIDGLTEHYKINPVGQAFRFRSFKQAEGCTYAGQPTAEHSWYTGYLWQFAHCGRCQTQLGWYFSGPEPFFGLINRQLKKCAQE